MPLSLEFVELEILDGYALYTTTFNEVRFSSSVKMGLDYK
jgi:hypothetical protein